MDNYREYMIDCIHYLVEQSNILRSQGMVKNAEVLMQEAEYFAKALKEVHVSPVKV